MDEPLSELELCRAIGRLVIENGKLRDEVDRFRHELRQEVLRCEGRYDDEIEALKRRAETLESAQLQFKDMLSEVGMHSIPEAVSWIKTQERVVGRLQKLITQTHNSLTFAMNACHSDKDTRRIRLMLEEALKALEPEVNEVPNG